MSSPPRPPRFAIPSPRRRWVVAVVLLALVAGFSVATARLFVWPDLPAVPNHADAIAVFGGPGNRREVALDLAREGHAPVVLISVSDDEIDTSWCQDGRLRGVPVICFHPDPYTTRGEARYVADLARQRGWTSLILVTTTDQAWRAQVRVSRCFDGTIAVAPAHLPLVEWPGQILYQWGATAKAYTTETAC
ncbi:MAG TPA: hypothetical protein VH561_17510 [Micromonosporaceae bacterium]